MNTKIVNKIQNAIEEKTNAIQKMEQQKAGFEKRLADLKVKMKDRAILEDQAVFNKTISEITFCEANLKSLDTYLAEEKKPSAADQKLFDQLSKEVSTEIAKIRRETIMKLTKEGSTLLPLIETAEKEQRGYDDLIITLAQALGLPVSYAPNLGSYLNQLGAILNIKRGFTGLRDVPME